MLNANDTSVSVILFPSDSLLSINLNYNFTFLTKDINQTKSNIFYSSPKLINDIKFQRIDSNKKNRPIGIAISALVFDYIILLDNSSFLNTNNNIFNKKFNIAITQINNDNNIAKKIRDALRPEFLIVTGESYNSDKLDNNTNIIYTHLKNTKIRFKKTLQGFINPIILR